MFVSNRDANHLDRSEPGRKRAGVMLGEDPEEPLDRPEQRAVDQHRALTGPIGGGVGEFETLRHGEVQLDGGHLPTTPQCVAHLH